MSDELDYDLYQLEIDRAAAEKSRLTSTLESTQAELRNERQRNDRLRWGHLRAGLITLAIGLTALGLVVFLFSVVGGGPTQRRATAVVDEQVRLSRTFEVNCPRAGGREVGVNSERVCVFPKATLPKYAEANSADRVRWIFACETVGGRVTGVESDVDQYCTFENGAVIPV